MALLWLLDKFFQSVAEDNADSARLGLAPADPEDMALWILGADDVRDRNRKLRLVQGIDEYGGEVA